MDWRAIDHGAPRYPAALDWLANQAGRGRERAIVRSQVESVALAQPDYRIVCLAHARRRLDQRTN
jgi:hypothetical protein